MSSAMSSPLPPQRRRSVGLPIPNPRSARQASNIEENERLNLAAAQQNVQPEVAPRRALAIVANQVGLDIDLTSGSSDEENFSDHDRGQSQNDRQDSVSESPPAGESNAGRVPAAASAAASTSARSRTQWNHNHPKLNLMARYVRPAMACLQASATAGSRNIFRYYLNQPERQEQEAVALNDEARLEHILCLKREPNRDLGHDNLKYAGQKFLLQKTAEELNACQEFANYKPATQEISTELLRQKIKEFQEIAVATAEADIDPRNISLLFIIRIKMTFCLQIASSGRLILD